MKRIPKPKDITYEFVENYAHQGCTVWAGVKIKGQFKISSDGLSITMEEAPEGSMFHAMPMSHLKKIEPIKLKKERKKKLIAPKKRILKKGEKKNLNSL